MKIAQTLYFVFALALLALGMVSCKDAEIAQFMSAGSEHTVELWSCGTKIGSWTSTGNISNESSSDGFFFKDKETGKLIEVSGTVIIKQL